MEFKELTPNKINLVYDYIGPYSVVPNGNNYRYLNSHISRNFDQKQDIVEDIDKIYDDGTSVFDGDSLLSHIVYNKLGIFEVPEEQDSQLYLYSVCIHGNPTAALGYPYTIHENFPFTRFISVKSIEYIKNRRDFFLFINYTTEGILNPKWFEKLYEELELFNIPPSKVIFSSATYTLKDDFDRWFNNLPETKEKINLLYFNWSFPTKHLEFTEIIRNIKENPEYEPEGNSFVTQDKFNKGIRPYKFLMFNRRLRQHRLYSVIYFHYKKIIDQFLISYDFIDKRCNILRSAFKPWVELTDNLIESQDVETTFNYIVEKDPVRTVDYESIGDVFGCFYENYEPYTNSYINVISETNFFEIGGYISEKTVKPIANLQPFILIGTPYSLKEIKKLGFKTFHPFINEEYDEIEDDTLRFHTILREIHRISQKSIEEIHEWYMSILPILKHNQDLLLDSKFFNRYLNDVKQNILKIYENNTAGS